MTTAEPLRILGLSGSLRRVSLNRAALEAAQELATSDMEITLFDLAPIPLYNEDLRAQGNPPAVTELRSHIAAADGVLIATPEYNYSIPAVLKNAIDWASRPPDQPFNGKPVAILGASPGRTGTARAQYHLRQCFVFLNAHLLNKPELMIAGANQLFDDEGKLVDPDTREHLVKLLAGFGQWIRRLQAGEAANP